VKDAFVGMPDQPSLVCALEDVTGQKVWLSRRDIAVLVMR